MTSDAIPFVEPTTREEAHACSGKTFETPYGVERCSGVGSSGPDRFQVSFGNQVVKGYSVPMFIWSSVHGWETHDEQKVRHWHEAWDRLKKSGRQLVTMVYGEALDALPVIRRKDPNKLVRAAKIRLMSRGYLDAKVCGRCGGSGHYSYNPMHGTTCFGCGGSGKVYPATTVAIKAARVFVKDGRPEKESVQRD